MAPVAPVALRRLVLVRHAKASPDDGSDLDRPLAGRGRADAPAVGRWLGQHGLVPDRVVMSPARRARQTWELAAGELGPTPGPEVDLRIYANSSKDLLHVIRDTPADVTTLVLVGHNPSIEALAVALDDGSGDPAARDEVAQKYATSGVAVFTVGDWPAVDVGTARLTAYAVPRG